MVIVGAGLSGIAMARQLGRDHPGLSYALIESRPRIGGTWDLFRYPGIRSDSGMDTFAFSFRPWPGSTHFGSGEEIRRYLEETAREHGIDRRIRFNRRVTAADWDSAAGRWSVTVAGAGGNGSGPGSRLRCRFLVGCTGYFRYDRGYDPPIEGEEDFEGEIFHAQDWPAGLELRGRRVTVIGSGATAVTTVPALARDGAEVTMLQRSPGYVVAVPNRSGFARLVKKTLPAGVAASLLRWLGVLTEIAQFQFARRFPDLARRLLIQGARSRLPQGFPKRHLNPRYDPWIERVCFAPDGDFFEAISSGAARIETGTISRVEADRVELRGGSAIKADVIVKATGLELLVFGGIRLSVDGETVDPSDRLVFKGAMLAGVPNFVFVVGYTNASWTLKSELVARFASRLLKALDRTGARSATPVPPVGQVETVPLLNLDSGYIRRALPLLPRAGDRPPWTLHMNYFSDRRELLHGELFDGSIRFS